MIHIVQAINDVGDREPRGEKLIPCLASPMVAALPWISRLFIGGRTVRTHVVQKEANGLPVFDKQYNLWKFDFMVFGR
ncbi:DNA-binding protein [Sesbania bispinosa]|nr:DNA-binding protein [Sesbania bispinosa]